MSQVYASLESVRFSSLSYVHLVSHNQTVDMLRPMSKPYNIPGIVDANAYADILGASPAYHQKETQRWTAALQLYQQMSSPHDEPTSSPPNSPVPEPKSLITTTSSTSETDEHDERSLAAVNSSSNDGLAMPPGPLPLDCPFPSLYSSLYSPDNNYPLMSLPTGRYGFMTPPIRPVGAIPAQKFGGSYVSPGESSLNSLELEAIAAVHELQFAVKDIFVSELLPRTSELIFLNVTTLEGQAYCIELTMKGWRVTSLRHDCMNGDYQHIDLHTRYFETIYALMDNISTSYRRKFSEALSAKLTLLQNLEKLEESGLKNTLFPNGILVKPPLDDDKSYSCSSDSENDKSQLNSLK